MDIENSKLLTLWRVLFQEKDYRWAALREYIAQMGDKKSVALVAYFNAFNPDFRSTRQTKILESSVYKVLLYKDAVSQARRDARIYNALSDLYQQTERFLWQKAAETRPFEPPYQVLLQIYTHHSLKAHFEDYWRVLSLAQTSQSLTQRTITEAHFLAEARVEFLRLYNTTDAAKAMHATDSALLSLLITNVLRYTFTIEMIGQQLSETFSNPFLAQALEYVAQHRKWAKTHPLLYVYYVLYLQIKALQNNVADKRWLAAWLRTVQNNQAVFDATELTKFYMAAENIAALIINKNTRDKTAYALLLSIYTAQRKLGFFLNADKSLEPNKFINYVNVAIKSNETANANEFITQIRTALLVKKTNAALSEPEQAALLEQQDIVRYARALVLFKEGKFQEVITKLRFRYFEDENLALRAEMLFIKAGYEREEAAHHSKGRHTEHGTRQSIDDFRKTIATTKTTTYILREKYDLFADTLLQFIDITDDYRRGYTPPAVKNALKNALTTQNVLLEREWFMEKCALL